MKNYYRIYAAMFLAFLAAFVILFIAIPDRKYSSSEKRNLTQLPKLSAASLSDGSFMEDITDYAADQFPFRDFWMKVKTVASKLLGNRLSQGVYTCGDNELMERFVASDPDNQKETIEAINDFIARYPNLPVYMLLSPNAISVYPEHLPAHALTDDQNPYIDAFYQELASNENFTALDVRPVFAREKEKTLVFYRTDHHWTTDGAFDAYLMMKDKMALAEDVTFEPSIVSNTFYGSLVSKSGFQVKTPDALKVYQPIYANKEDEVLYTVTYVQEAERKASLYEPSALTSDNPYEVFFGSNHPMVTIDTTADVERSILIIKDSYANSLVPFLIPHYSKITMVDPRYFYDDIDALASSGEYTEVLFLYNVNTLYADNVLKTVLTNQQ